MVSSLATLPLPLQARNLIFNTVLDTGDHGNFNSWDRKLWLWLDDPYDSKSTVKIVPNQHHLHNNFIIRTSFLGPSNNLYCIDHDDGSSSYNDTDNFLVYGGIKFREGIEKHASGPSLTHCFSAALPLDSSKTRGGSSPLCAPGKWAYER